MENQKILTIGNKRDEKFLRQKTADFDFKTHNRKEISELIRQMRQIMKAADGVGLSTNQIGLDWRLFVVEIPQDISTNPSNQHKSASKFYAIFNPGVIKLSKEKSVMEEGCLSVPNMAGLVERPEKITLVGQDKNGKKLKIKAWGLLARIFQHETDHLNGILFIDKATNLQKYENVQKYENGKTL